MGREKDFSEKNFKDKIGSLSKEIIVLSKDMRANVLQAVMSTADVALEYLRIELKRSDSSRTRFGILNVLITHDGRMNLTDISRRVFRSKYTVTRVVDKLEKKGLVKRESVLGDRRIKSITITRKGIHFIRKTMPRRKKISDETTSCLDQEQMVTLVNLLKQVRKHLLHLIATKGA